MKLKCVIFVDSYEQNQLFKITIVLFVNTFQFFAKYLKWFVKKRKTLTKLEQHFIDFTTFTFHLSLQAGYTL